MMRRALQRAVGATAISGRAARVSVSARLLGNSAASNNEYLETSIIPTDFFQNVLPRLPIPPLGDTCERYLRSQEAYLVDSPVELQATKDLVNRFRYQVGPDLQNELKAQNNANAHTSYVTEAWYEMYLAARTPLPINYNPTVSWADDFSASEGNKDPLEMRLVRLTNLVVSSLRFKRSLDENVLSPELYHITPERTKTPEFRTLLSKMPLPRKLIWLLCAGYYNCYALDVSQYARLFCASRVPVYDATDTLVKFGVQPPRTGVRLLDTAGQGQYSDSELRTKVRHVVVLRGGRLFKVNVLDINGQIRAATEIYAALRRIATSPLPKESHPIGVLSSLNRDRWGSLRAKLRSSEANREALRDLESAIFAIAYDDQEDFTQSLKSGDKAHLSPPGIISLDTVARGGGGEKLAEVNQTFRTFLLGNGANRYWDKSFTLISTPNCKFGVNFEHSWGDGVAVLRYLVDTYANARNSPALLSRHLRFSAAHATTASDHDVVEIRFQLDDSLKAAIDDAQKDFRSRCADVDNRAVIYNKFGKNFLKENKLSPDAIAQLSVQMAYFRQYGRFGAAYESCSTAAYRHGRTETIRPLTAEARDCVLAFEAARGNKQVTSNPLLNRWVYDTQPERLAELVHTASAKHGRLVVEAATGRGWDRHLFALRRLAERRNPPSPSDVLLFQDPSYKRIGHIQLSASTLSDPALEAGGFGAVTPDGYGVGYAPFDDWMAVNVTNFPKFGTDLAQFSQYWTDALDDIHRVLTLKKK